MFQAACFGGKILMALVWVLIAVVVVIMFAPAALIEKCEERGRDRVIQPD